MNKFKKIKKKKPTEFKYVVYLRIGTNKVKALKQYERNRTDNYFYDKKELFTYLKNCSKTRICYRKNSFERMIDRILFESHDDIILFQLCFGEYIRDIYEIEEGVY